MKAEDMNRVLYIDLTKKDIRMEERGDLFDEYLGGSGVAIKLLEKECPSGIDTLDALNPIIFAVGPLTALYPSASKRVFEKYQTPLKFVIMFNYWVYGTKIIPQRFKRCRMANH